MFYKPFVSIIVPTYSVSKLIIYTIKAIEKVMELHGYEYEIIVVDDGSPDDTYSYAFKASKNPIVRVYRLPRNTGKGFALLYGFKKSRGEIIVFFDSDLDIDPRQIHLLVNTLRSNGVDIAITSKWHPQSRTIATPIRKFLSKSFYAFARLLLGLKVSDIMTGAKSLLEGSSRRHSGSLNSKEAGIRRRTTNSSNSKKMLGTQDMRDADDINRKFGQ